MAVIRSNPTKNFTQIPNSIFESGLSPKSICALCLMLSCPADWVFCKAWVRKKLGIGRDACDSIFKELAEAGYLISTQLFDENGKFSGYDYAVYDVKQRTTEKPDTSRTTEKPDTGMRIPRTTENPHLQINKDNKQTDYTNIQADSVESANEANDAFEFFWENSGLTKQKKQRAKEAWNNAVCTRDPYAFANELITDCQKRLALCQYGFDKLHPSTYLTEKRWEDEYVDNRTSVQTLYEIDLNDVDDHLHSSETDITPRPDLRTPRQRVTAAVLDLKNLDW